MSFLSRAAVLAAAGMLAAGCASSPRSTHASPLASSEVASVVPNELTCGQPWRPGTSEFEVTGAFPASVAAGTELVRGTVKVTTHRAVRGEAGPGAEIFVVREGLIVATPLPMDAMAMRWELAAGQSRTLPGAVILVSCAPSGGPLPPGDYQLFARVVFRPGTGKTVSSFGGPWSLQVT